MNPLFKLHEFKNLTSENEFCSQRLYSLGNLFSTSQNLELFQKLEDERTEFQKKIDVLEKKNYALEERMRLNKVFIYMIIHDLKHPTECIVTSLKHMETKLSAIIQEHLLDTEALLEVLGQIDSQEAEENENVPIRQVKQIERRPSQYKFSSDSINNLNINERSFDL